MKNGHKKAIIPYHLLRKSPFDVPLNSFIIWISDKEASRIIQSHHVTYTNERFFRPRVETQLLIALFFLPFGTPDSGSKFRRYQVFMSYHWASAGMTKGNRLSKRKRNVLRRDDGSIFIIIPSKYALLTKREVNMTGYLAKFPFCILCTETKSRSMKN